MIIKMKEVVMKKSFFESLFKFFNNFFHSKKNKSHLQLRKEKILPKTQRTPGKKYITKHEQWEMEQQKKMEETLENSSPLVKVLWSNPKMREIQIYKDHMSGSYMHSYCELCFIDNWEKQGHVLILHQHLDNRKFISNLIKRAKFCGRIRILEEENKKLHEEFDSLKSQLTPEKLAILEAEEKVEAA